MTQGEPFYIGWQDRAAPSLARWVRRRALFLLACAAALGAVVTSFHAPPSTARFEFGVVRRFNGRLEHIPYPTLVVARPGSSDSASRWLLTLFGKRGADEITRPLDGHDVQFDGSLIHRDGVTMVELSPETLVDLGVTAAPDAPPQLGPIVRLEGEIVDSKCFLGVMKPGDLKTHRACAARCISGGVPPVLLVRDADGQATYHLLVDATGAAVNDRGLDWIAVEGRLLERDGLSVLYADPARFEHR